MPDISRIRRGEPGVSPTRSMDKIPSRRWRFYARCRPGAGPVPVVSAGSWCVN